LGTIGPPAATTIVPLCDLGRQTTRLEPELLAAVQRVLRSGRFILGPEEEAFTNELAAYVGARFAVGVASCTDALVLALKAAGLRPGGRVLTTPFSFFATAEAIVLAGGEPVFCDIDPVTYNLDLAKARAVLDGESPSHLRIGITPETIQAILPVHLFGHPAEIVELRALADSRGSSS
jgi:dTDP-4-amino-4,6-dideoxygalactose transaminase